jgi:predicted metalloprotease with PDZ domain
MKFHAYAALALIAAQFASHNVARAQTSEPVTLRSAPIYGIRYDVTYDSATAIKRVLSVTMSFTTHGAGDVLLSLPAWTPGEYEIQNFARYITEFTATEGTAPASWDKADQDTWRIRATRVGQMRVSFDYLAMTLDNSSAWSKPDFAFFNGTNLFLYPEGQSTDFPATVGIHTLSSWRIATGMTQTGPATFTASNYHDLVDMPFFVGRFDIDSIQASGKWTRFATYPAGSVPISARRMVLDQLSKIIPPEVAVFGEVPWNTYTVLQVADSGYAAGSASGLEHQNSHFDIISSVVLGNPVLASLYAHEIFHAWNVKRLRPVEMWPYVYDHPQPTPLLWISEGITDYYADLAEVRAHITTPEQFYSTTTGKIDEVDGAPPVALEDASLTTWIKPVDGTEDIYYPKGSLAGLLLDIMIRDASDNQRSLDTVMRDLYQSAYKHGHGFSDADWWATVSRAAGGKSFASFDRRYIDGRDPFPYDSILPLGGLRLVVDRTVLPNLGISSSLDEQGRRVIALDPVGTGAAAGVKVGDYLISVGGLDVGDEGFGAAFSAKYAGMPPGGTIPVIIRRGTQQMTLNATANFRTSERRHIVAMTDASPKALRVREGLLSGTTRP